MSEQERNQKRDQERFWAMKAYGLRAGQVNKLMARLDAMKAHRNVTFTVTLRGGILNTLRREAGGHYLFEDMMLQKMVFFAIERAHRDHVKAGVVEPHIVPNWHEEIDVVKGVKLVQDN